MERNLRRRVAILFAGGAALSDAPRTWERVRSANDAIQWLDHLPELRVIADLEPVFVTARPALSLGAPEWRALAEQVRSRVRSIDGVVVLHGIETIHYAANALSLMARSLPFPIVLAGGRTSPDTGRDTAGEPGARSNVINAVSVATSDLAEVCVIAGNRILRGSRVQLAVDGSVPRVTVADGSLLGRIDFGIKLFPDRVRRAARTPRFSPHLDPAVHVVTIAPGTQAATLRRSLEGHVHGVLVRFAPDLVALPPDIVAQLEAATARGVIVAVAPSTRVVDLPAAFLRLAGLSDSMAVVKLMWAIGSGKRGRGLAAWLQRDVARETLGAIDA